jgi:hypothetical protein
MICMDINKLLDILKNVMLTKKIREEKIDAYTL